MVTILARPQEGWRIKPAYTFGQTARLAGVHPITVKRWLLGYQAPVNWMPPVFGGDANDNGPTVSFLELAEIVVVAGFRKRRAPLERIRRAHRFASERFGLEFPFASLPMRSIGRNVMAEFEQSEPGPSLLVLDAFSQLALPGEVAETVEGFEYVERWAARWFPVGDKALIVVDPQVGAAKPTVFGRGVTIEAIHRRWKAGQAYRDIGKEYRLSAHQVEEILRFADKVAA